MADSPNKIDDKVTHVNEQKLDNGYSKPGDSRTDDEPVLMNASDTDFSPLKGTAADNPDLPLDNTPIGQALGHSDGREMTQQEGNEEIPLKDDPSQQDNPKSK